MICWRLKMYVIFNRIMQTADILIAYRKKKSESTLFLSPQTILHL